MRTAHTDHQSVSAIIVEGRRIASGLNPDTPYPGGTINAQLPHFQKFGLHADSLWPGTLNCNLAPSEFVPNKPTVRIEGLLWWPGRIPENFSLYQCHVIFSGVQFSGYLYCPDPLTKVHAAPEAGIVEVLCQHISGIRYGDTVEIRVSPAGGSFLRA